ncbi:MAG: right-handed parallel beta-helix repeat-containing protein, partial [Elusimicrobia bacterium]|nr:right-handed parallel beta-helix repeat-containing protein [Candidatus Liberimonas magnetica]
IVIGNRGWGGAVVIVRGNGSEIENCIINHAFYGLLALKGAAISVKDSSFKDNKIGFWLYKQSLCEIYKNSFTNNIIGIYCAGGENIKINTNIIIRNKVRGIIFVKVRDSLAYDNTINGSDVGIDVWGCNRTNIIENTINKNNVGVLNCAAKETVIKNNKLNYNKNIAVYGDERNRGCIISDNILLNNQSAIRFQDDGDKIIIEKNIVKNGDHGISINGKTRATINNNSIITKISGAECSDNSIVSVANNDITVSRIGSCIRYSVNAKGAINKNKLVGNIGIEMLGVNRVKIDGIKIEAINQGVTIKDLRNVDILNSIIACKNGNCIEYDMSSTGAVKRNRLNGLTGIQLLGNAEVYVEKNDIKTINYGVNCSHEAKAQIKRIEIESLNNGIEVYNLCSVNITDTAINSKKGICIKYDMNASGMVHNTSLSGNKGFKAGGGSQVEINKINIKTENAGISAHEISNVKITDSDITCRKGVCVKYDMDASGIVCNTNVSGHKGLETNGGSQVDISKSHIKSESIGINVYEISNVNINDSKIICKKGVCVKYDMDARGIVCNTSMSGNKGLEANGGSQVEISKSNVKSEDIGLSVYDISNVNIVDSKIACGKGVCIRYSMNTTGIIGSNTLNGTKGIEVIDSSNITIKDNKLYAKVRGILYKDSSSGTIENNEISGKSENIGMEISGHAELEIKGNSITAVEKGMICIEESLVKVEGIKIESENTAIEVNDISNVNIYDSSLNSKNGICIKYSMNTIGVVKKNSLAGLKGVEVGGSCQVEIANNNIEAQAFGIEYKEQSSGIIEDNNIVGHTKTIGIEINNISEVAIKRNKINGVSYGIRYSDESKIESLRNEIIAKQYSYFENKAIENNDISLNVTKKGRMFSGDISLFYNFVRNIVLSTRQYGIFNIIYRQIYFISLKVLKLYFNKSGDISGIYLRRGLTSNDWIPGASDIDLLFRLSKVDNEDEVKLINRINKAYNLLKVIFPFYGEFQIVTIEEFDRFTKSGSIRSLEFMNKAKLISGSLEKIENKIDIKSRSVTLSALTEMINSYFKLNDIFFNNDKSLASKLLFVKSVIDIIKYYIYTNAKETDCFINSSTNTCIVYSMNTTGIICSNVLNGNKGIVVIDSSNITIKDNKLYTKVRGILYKDSSSGTIENNEISGKSENIGMEISGHAELEIKGNSITAVEKGMICIEESLVKVEGIKIESENTAIEVNDISNVNIYDSSLNSKNGICIKYSMNTIGVVKKNSLAGLKGVEVGGSCQVEIANNNIEAQAFGIEYKEQSSGIIEDNNIVGHTKTIGIEINNISEVAIKRNKINGVSYGIRYSDESKIESLRNEIIAKQYSYFENKAIENNDISLNVTKKGRMFSGDISLFYNFVRNIVLSTRQYGIFNIIYRQIYFISLKVLKLYFNKSGDISGIYLRRGLTSNDWIPGASDIDLLFRLSKVDNEDEVKLINRINKAYNLLKVIFPFYGEFQIVTIEEFDRFTKSGSIRSLEFMNKAKLISGSLEKIENKIDIKSRSVTLSALTEMINSYFKLNDIFFNNDKSLASKLLFVKSVIDIIKYYIYTNAKETEFIGRTAVLDYFINNCGDKDDMGLVNKLRDAWVNNIELKESDYKDAFLFIIGYLESVLPGLISGLDGPGNREDVKYKYGDIKYYNVIDINQVSRWERLCKEIIQISAGDVKSIIFDSPGYLYIIIKALAFKKPEFLKRLAFLHDNLKVIDFSKNTPMAVLTDNMFQAIQFSLHLETPFNYFKLLGNNAISLSNTGEEERWQYMVRKDDYRKPSDDILGLLIKESINILNLSLRMYGGKQLENKRRSLIYLYNRILSLHLAVDKNIIVEPYISNILNYYKEYYPEHSINIDNFKDKYLNKSNYTVNLMSSREIFRDNYGFLRDILNKLNMNYE